MRPFNEHLIAGVSNQGLHEAGKVAFQLKAKSSRFKRTLVLFERREYGFPSVMEQVEVVRQASRSKSFVESDSTGKIRLTEVSTKASDDTADPSLKFG